MPLGSPFFLWNFLIRLELLSQFIRPLTLRLRLRCNLMAGHVLMSLASNLGVISYFLLRILILFEVAVSIVQSLVYRILTDIYKKESRD